MNITLYNCYRVSRDQLIIDWGDALPDVNEAPLPSPITSQKVPETSDLVNLENTMGRSTLMKFDTEFDTNLNF